MRGSALALVAVCVLTGTASAQNSPRQPNPSAIRLPNGYKIEAVVINLSVPTTAIFDGNDLLVAESGWARTARARVLRIKPNGTVTVEVDEGLDGPVTRYA